ncbi:MAG TPA: tetrathionate reductase family octaheme c-type cytochrome [Anaerolineae bacterium]|nr:tetrathionate reductase family octaheme c-type cytochrome [Anaerolineae bacterium]
MKDFKLIWLFGLLATALTIITPITLFITTDNIDRSSPWQYVQPTPVHTSHAALITGPFATGSAVTQDCLSCHPDAAHQVANTVHFTWESEPLLLPDRDDPVTIGKKNQINNFCIGIQGNWDSCTRCHAGYGWEDDTYDFEAEENVDCLVCHADTNLYAKGKAGQPLPEVDLVAAAQSVGRPTRDNCGSCHFNGGGGNAVKHGDLDESLYYPNEEVDVHMGRYDFQCVDCHQTEDHQISGHMISVSPIATDDLACTNCHDNDLHTDDRINNHTDTVACQTCHIPEVATRNATKIAWDWSTAGQDLPEDPHVYLKIKGNFIYEHNLQPTYAWFNGNADRYIVGDTIDPTLPTPLNQPLGTITDPNAQLWPFKIHEAFQPYDTQYNYLLIPRTAGDNGFWTNFDWNQAFLGNQEDTGLAYSGQYDFAPTTMHWTLTHLVQPKENALACTSCHGRDQTRIDWNALGYYGDPIYWGGRQQQLGLNFTLDGE